MVGLADTIKEDMVSKAEDAGTPNPEADATAKPDADASAADADAKAGATPAAPADAAPQFSEEDISRFSSDPRIVDAVLKGAGQDRFDEILKEVLAEKETTAKTQAQQQEQAKTLDEAVRLYQEDGDASAFGEIVIKQYLAEREARPVIDRVTKDVSEKAEIAFIEDLNEATSAVYGDVIETLKEEDYAKLDRNNFGSRREWITGVYRFLDTRRGDMLRSESGSALSAAEEATKVATAAAKAREAGGIGALPGGTGVEKNAGGDSIGGLIRQAMADSYQYEE